MSDKQPPPSGADRDRVLFQLGELAGKARRIDPADVRQVLDTSPELTATNRSLILRTLRYVEELVDLFDGAAPGATR